MEKKILALFFLCACLNTSAQKFQFDIILGQYDHNYNVNGQFNGVVTETSNTSSNMEFTVGLMAKKQIHKGFGISAGIINYSTFIESMLFWDTTEDQFLGQWVKKATSLGARTYSFPIKLSYDIEVLENFKFQLGVGVEYFFFRDNEPLGDVDLGRQHPRLNDFLPRIDQAFFKNRLVGIFSIGLRYKRVGLEFQTRTSQENSFDSFQFEGTRFQPKFSREIWSYTLSYTFLKVDK